MNESVLLAIAASLVATMFGLLTAILAWIGNRIHNKMDEILSTLRAVENDLHGRITELDRRVTRVEARSSTHRDLD